MDLEKMALWGPKEKRARLGDMGWTDQKVKRACRASLDLGDEKGYSGHLVPWARRVTPGETGMTGCTGGQGPRVSPASPGWTGLQGSMVLGGSRGEDLVATPAHPVLQDPPGSLVPWGPRAQMGSMGPRGREVRLALQEAQDSQDSMELKEHQASKERRVTQACLGLQDLRECGASGAAPGPQASLDKRGRRESP